VQVGLQILAWPRRNPATSDGYSNCLGLSPAWNQVIIE
jgi:hypothetical protein